MRRGPLNNYAKSYERHDPLVLYNGGAPLAMQIFRPSAQTLLQKPADSAALFRERERALTVSSAAGAKSCAL
jgi:hypothetical protein